jgi:lysozyme family protein
MELAVCNYNYNTPVNLFDVKFEKIINNLLISDIYDHKNKTKFGISQKSYPALNIENLTLQEAKFLYYRDYWLPQLYRYINSIEVAEMVFSLAMDIGTYNAHIVLQRALRALGYTIKEDGVLGKVTLTAVNKINPDELLFSLKHEIVNCFKNMENI